MLFPMSVLLTHLSPLNQYSRIVVDISDCGGVRAGAYSAIPMVSNKAASAKSANTAARWIHRSVCDSVIISNISELRC